MQNLKCISYRSAIRSEMVFRYSYPGTYNPLYYSDKERIQTPQIDVEKLRRLSNTSSSSHDSGVGFSKADYEIQRAIKAQRVQRPHIILLHKGRPVSHINTLNNHDEFEANIVVAAATASKRNRRGISVMHRRQTIVSYHDNNDNAENLGKSSYLKNNSAPNLCQTTQLITKKALKMSQEEQEGNKVIKNHNILFMPKRKLFRSVSLSIKKFVGTNKEKKRQSHFIQKTHHK